MSHFQCRIKIKPLDLERRFVCYFRKLHLSIGKKKSNVVVFKARN